MRHFSQIIKQLSFFISSFFSLCFIITCTELTTCFRCLLEACKGRGTTSVGHFDLLEIFSAPLKLCRRFRSPDDLQSEVLHLHYCHICLISWPGTQFFCRLWSSVQLLVFILQNKGKGTGYSLNLSHIVL